MHARSKRVRLVSTSKQRVESFEGNVLARRSITTQNYDIVKRTH